MKKLIAVKRVKQKVSVQILVIYACIAFFAIVNFIKNPTLHFDFVFLVDKIFVAETIEYIPEENIVDSTFINCSLDVPDQKHIIFFDKKNSFKGVKGFVRPMKGNPYYTSAYYEGLEDDLNYQAYHHNTTIVHLKNMYVAFSSALVTPDLKFLKLDKIQSFARKKKNGTLLGSFDSVIALTDAHIYYFSHWFYDTLAPLTIFPQDIIDKSFIIRYRGTGCPIEPIHAFGLNESKLLILGQKNWIFARNVYTTIPQSHNKHYGLMMTLLSQKLRKYYGVDTITPTVYGVTNRNKGEARYIKNMDKIMPLLQQKFPDYNLTFLADEKMIKKAALQWSSCKFMFSPTGSNCIKHLFMKEKSVMVVGLGSHTDNCIGLSAAAHDIYTMYYRIKTMGHWKKQTENTLDIAELTRVCDIGLYCAKHGKWRNNEVFAMKK